MGDLFHTQQLLSNLESCPNAWFPEAQREGFSDVPKVTSSKRGAGFTFESRKEVLTVETPLGT